MTSSDAGYGPQDDRAFVPGFADPDTEELQQQRPGSGSFDVVRRGYERSQVDGYLAQVRWTLDELRGELASAQEQARTATAEAQRLRNELERGRPDAEAIGGRVGKIMALAEAEAEQIRAEANRQLQGVNAERQKIVDDAQAHAESLVTDARRHAAQMTEGARREATQATETARREVDALTRQRSTILGELQRAHQHLGQVIAQASGPQAQEQTQPVQQAHPQTQVVRLSDAEDRSVVQLPTR